jgi:hypothetical protein
MYTCLYSSSLLIALAARLTHAKAEIGRVRRPVVCCHHGLTWIVNLVPIRRMNSYRYDKTLEMISQSRMSYWIDRATKDGTLEDLRYGFGMATRQGSDTTTFGGIGRAGFTTIIPVNNACTRRH